MSSGIPSMIITPAMTPERARKIADTFDLRALPPDFYANPYPVYAALREHEPARRMPDGSYFLTRYADLVAVYRDAQTFSSDKKAEFGPKYGQASPLFEHHTTSLVFNDPPLHTRVRQLIMGALTRRAIDSMEAGLVTLVDGLLDRIEAQGGGDLVGDFAAAIPVEIIGNLLGVPHADRGPLRGWSLAILGALEPALTPEQEALGNRSVSEFGAYLKNLVAERRRHPGDPEHDVLTRLIHGDGSDTHEARAGSEPLSETELLQNCIFILNAGHETTTNLIGNALVALQEWPDAKHRLLSKMKLSAQNPQGLEADLTLAVDEFLRFESSNQLGNRRALKACSVGGIQLEAGTLITLGIGAANRDPAQFADPDVLNLARGNGRHGAPGSKHLAFGVGIHQCAGLSLARLEGRIAISRFLQRFPDYRLTQMPTRGGRARFRGFLHAPFASA
ncbi:cytochrome P450 [Rhodoferax sediminis]|uniref:Cytochrome P450 n=1 Tax=Rhodoferax sediminis TaxID=2509614 RepID=A0A515D9H5_9BURK|nr:cytochrome P450 [Rhodoferax sediminis]QDL37063.1 cytochrome P450 [Rhodoferax sediminis]